jgi:transcriptional regulator GlxA family with amidase domain
MTDARVIVFTVYDGMRLLDLTGPLDTFALANDLHPEKRQARYVLRIVSVNGGLVRTSSGLSVSTEPLSALDGITIDTLIVGGGAVALRADSSAAAVDEWLKSQSALVQWIGRRGVQARRLCSVCTGTFLLARAGLLTGRTVATHWATALLLANCFPALRVEQNSIFERDGTIWTSGGVTAGIDLALALIESDLGGIRRGKSRGSWSYTSSDRADNRNTWYRSRCSFPSKATLPRCMCGWRRISHAT